jgi:predicted nuclease of predicted toxin-antitoxin system
MKILLDEDLPRRLRHYFPGHEAVTVLWMGWGGVQNGNLLDLVEAHGFDIFVTGDQGIPFQQNLRKRQIAFIVLVARNNQFETLEPLMSKAQEAVEGARPGTVVYIEE